MLFVSRFFLLVVSVEVILGVQEAGLKKGAEGKAMMWKYAMRKEVVRRPDELNLVYSATGFAFVMITPSRLHVGHGQRVSEKGHLSLLYSEGFSLRGDCYSSP